jgi:predicted O-linked N-acetylglucosamine transferase (SPINDLY family)
MQADRDPTRAARTRIAELLRARRHAEALAEIDAAAAGAPDDAKLALNRGSALLGLDRVAEALAAYDRAVALDPGYAAAHANRALALERLGRADDALGATERAIALDPGLIEAHAGRTRLLDRAGRLGDAVAALDALVKLRPRTPRAWRERAETMRRLERFGEALDSYDAAIALEPADAASLSNRGVVLRALGRLDEALDSYDRAVAASPARGPHYNRGNLLAQLGRRAEAVEAFAAALRQEPEEASTRWNRSHALLALGRLAEGWRDYAYRWGVPDWPKQRATARPRWRGNAPVAGRRILVWGEQGLGDRIQFCRYVPLLAARGAHVLLETDPRLVTLLRGLEGVERIAAFDGAPFPDSEFDLQIPLLALPMAFGEARIEDIPARVPYLRAPEAAQARWRGELGAAAAAGAPVIGVAWSGNPKPDPARSIALAEFARLLDAPAAFLGLQRDLRPEDAPALARLGRLRHFGERIADMSDTAALCAGCELVITIDTSLAHLAGAMGKPVWILLPFPADWRWLEGREDSPWYPTARLYRQTRPGDWSGVLAQVARDLAAWLAARPAARGDGAAAGAAAGTEGTVRAAKAQAARLLRENRNAEALAALDPVLALAPRDAALALNHGNALLGLGRAAEAIDSYDRALAADPAYAPAHANRALALERLGRPEEALEAVVRAGALDPALAAAQAARARILCRLDRVAEAMPALDTLVRLRPAAPASWSQRADALRRLGRLEEAAGDYAEAIRLDPGDRQALSDRGVVLRALGRLDEALECYDRAVALSPGDGPYYNRANLLAQLGRAEAALADYDAALRRAPGDAPAQYNRAALLEGMGRLPEALAGYDAAIAADPGHVDACNNRGNLLVTLGRIDEAIDSLQAAIRLKPDGPGPHANLSNAYALLGLQDEALASLREAQRVASPAEAPRMGIRPYLNAIEALSPAELARMHFAAGRAMARACPPPRVHPAPAARAPGRALRVGYVSPDLCAHSVAFFFEPVLARHDPARVQAICYDVGRRRDAVGERLRGLAQGWVEAAGMDDDALAARIAADGIDILVDLAGHTNGNRLAVFQRRPAPVQATWIGYPNTTGLETIGYRLTDAIADPPGEADALHSERLVRLPRGFLCYRPPDEAPPPSPRPGVAGPGRAIAFGSFNSLLKLAPGTLDCWARILGRVAGSRLVLKAPGLTSPRARARILALFAARGIAPGRIDLLPFIGARAEHLAAYGRIDIALDSFPYNGTTTTCEALWMGVPVVTLRGDRHAARVGASLLHRIGLDELVAADTAAYVETACRLAADRDRLAATSAGLRARMRASPLCDAAGFARDLERAYVAMAGGAPFAPPPAVDASAAGAPAAGAPAAGAPRRRR